MSIEAMIAAIAGSGIGGIVAGGLAVYALTRGSVYAWRERGDLFKAQLAEERERAANEQKAHQDELADLHTRKVDEQDRMQAVVRGKDLRIAQLEKVLHEYATIPAVRARLEQLDGVLPEVSATDKPDPGGSAKPVQDPDTPSMEPILSLK